VVVLECLVKAPTALEVLVDCMEQAVQLPAAAAVGAQMAEQIALAFRAVGEEA
jgi:hypothetical protein